MNFKKTLVAIPLSFSLLIPAAGEGLKVHVDQLLMAFDSYAESDYETAYNSIHKAYNHMFGFSQMMDGAVVDQLPENFAGEKPFGMPKIGMGGMN